MVRLRSEGKKKKSVHVSKAPAFLDFLFVHRNVCNLENFMLASVSFWKGQKVVRSRVCEIHEDQKAMATAGNTKPDSSYGTVVLSRRRPQVFQFTAEK